MTKFERVRKIAAESLGLHESDVHENSSLRADLDADSLEIAQLVLDLEDEFHCEIPDDDLANIFTIADIVKYAESHPPRPRIASNARLA